MERFSFLGKKIALVLLAVVLVFSATPRTAQAQLATFDAAAFIKHTASLFIEQQLNLKEFVLDPVAYSLAKQALQSVTNGILDWIGSGFEGSPAFATDFRQSLLRIGDTVALGFVQQLQSSLSIQSPFGTRVAQAVRDNYFRATGGNSFFALNQYNLSNICPEHAAFLSGDFSSCGLSGWIAAWRNPAQNEHGALLVAEDELQSRVASETDRQRTELDWGRGFFSRRQCPNGTSAPAGGDVALADTDPTVNCPVVTAGSMIMEAGHSANIAGLDALISADEIDEVLGQLFNTLINKVISDSGLLGALQPGSAGDNTGRSALEAAGDSSQSGRLGTGSASASFSSVIDGQLGGLTTYQQSWQRIQAAAQSAASRCVAGSDTDRARAQLILSQSSTELGQVASAISTLTQIRTQLMASGREAQITAVQRASASYDEFLASGVIPSASEVSFAAEQSVASDPGEPPTLVTEMSELCVGT